MLGWSKCMTNAPTLFRKQVLDTPDQRNYGELVLNRSLSSWTIVWCALAMSIGIIAFLCLGHYTRRVNATGLLMPENGLLRVFSPSGGIVAERLVSEGAQVKKGQLLFVVADVRGLASAEVAPVPPAAPAVAASGLNAAVHPASGQAINIAPNFANAIAESIAMRLSTLEAERAQTERSLMQSQTALKDKITRLQVEREALQKEIALYKLREESSRQRLTQDQSLAQSQFLSAQAVQQRQDELTSAQAALSSASRSALVLERDQTDAKNELAQIPLRLSAQMAGFAQRKATIEQESTESRVRMRVAVVAPEDGLVTAILSEAGSAVGTQPLATILPAGSQLQAQLFVAGRSAGFVEAGQQVRIRYQAFPYQKFGQFTGLVSYVSKAQLTQESMPLGAPPPLQADGPGVYRVTVKLDSQTIMAYGKSQALVAGMVLEADIKQDTRSLIEWIFEPVYSIKGKLFS
jgi:membrane fusion protein